MSRICLIIFVVSFLYCTVNAWTVFPLPDTPVISPGTVSSYVKPTPVLTSEIILSTRDEINQIINVKPTSVLPQQSFTIDTFPEPAIDLLPPKIDYEYQVEA